jgi:hypothetical protein
VAEYKPFAAFGKRVSVDIVMKTPKKRTTALQSATLMMGASASRADADDDDVHDVP